MYYQNIECEVISKIDEYESVIEVEQLSEYSEPTIARIIVQNKDLSKSKIVKSDIFKERDEILRDARVKAREIINNANTSVREEHNDLMNFIKELKKNKDNVQKENEYYQTAINLRNGIYKYVVYGFKIMSFEDFKNEVAKECTYEDEPDFKDISLKISTNMLSYKKSGYWNSSFVDLCETKECAIEILAQKLKVPDNLSIGMVKEMRTHNIVIDEISEKVKKCIDEHNENILKNIERIESQIESYKSQKVAYA